jgi:hypothetical protein
MLSLPNLPSCIHIRLPIEFLLFGVFVTDSQIGASIITSECKCIFHFVSLINLVLLALSYFMMFLFFKCYNMTLYINVQCSGDFTIRVRSIDFFSFLSNVIVCWPSITCLSLCMLLLEFLVYISFSHIHVCSAFFLTLVFCIYFLLDL